MDILAEYKNNIISCLDIYNSNIVDPNIADIILEFMFLNIFSQTKNIVKKLLFWLVRGKLPSNKEILYNPEKNLYKDFNYEYKGENVQVYTRDKIIELINFVSDIDNWTTTTVKEEEYIHYSDYVHDNMTYKQIDMINKVLPDIFQMKGAFRYDQKIPKYLYKYFLDCYCLIKLSNKN